VFSSLAHLARLADALYVFAREGVLAIPDPSGLPGSARALLRGARLLERRSTAGGAVRLAAALTRLGPTYVKLGQFLATRPDLVGLALSRDLETLQDKMPPFPQAVAEAEIAAAFGRPLEELFACLGPAVAAASIAQVHRAEILTDGVRRPVAVKVLRPHIEARFKADLQSFRFGARWAERVSAEARRLRLCEIVETLARSVTLEMDLRLEAAAIGEMAGNIAADADFRVPTVDWTRTEKAVLTLEWIDATPLSDRAALHAKGYDLPRLGQALMQNFLRHALRDGFFHADLHPGNLFVDADGRLIAVDFGIMGRLGLKERRFLAEILYGFLTRNYRRTAEVHFEAGYVPTRHSVESFAQALRAIGEPIHSRTAAEISMARTLTLLFEVTGLFDMQTRPELLLLQKTMVVVEGVARSLDPKLDMWRTSDPVVREWIERHLGPVGRIEDAARGAGEIGKALAAMPALIGRVADLANQFAAMRPETLFTAPRPDAEAQTRRTRRLMVVLCALVVGLGVVMLWRL
jgi:ubiquinone biosynthesis protein